MADGNEGDNMKVVENKSVRDKVFKTLEIKRFPVKTFSVIRLIGCPRRTYYKMKGEYEIGAEDKTLIFARGRGIGSELEKAFKFREIHRKVDDIRGDVDAIGDRVVEIYSTNLSSGKVEDVNEVAKVFDRKVRQLMAYCYMLKETKGDLLVFFMSGDYTRFTEVAGKKVYTGIQPKLKCWTLEFTEEEIKENWTKLLDNKAEIELALKTGIAPLVVGEEWECRTCGFSHICFPEVVEEKDVSEVVAKVMEDDLR